MQLHLTATSERGKPVTKSGNEYIEVKILNENRDTIAIISFDTKKLAIMSIREDIEVDMRQMSKPKTARECEECKKHGTEYMERHKLDGHYICRACVIASLK